MKKARLKLEDKKIETYTMRMTLGEKALILTAFPPQSAGSSIGTATYARDALVLIAEQAQAVKEGLLSPSDAATRIEQFFVAFLPDEKNSA